MKNVLFATSALVAMTAGGAAFADGHEGGISLSGDARLGIMYLDDNNPANDEIYGTSRVRVKFSASGTSDSGINFGFNIRADNAGGGAGQAGIGVVGTDPEVIEGVAADKQRGVQSSGDVYVEGSFGKLTFGDTDSGLKKRVSNVDAISLTGLYDINEIHRGAEPSPRIRYDYDFSSFGISISTRGDLESFSVGVGGSFDFGSNSVSVGLGYDDSDSTIAASIGTSFGPVDFKVAYSTGDTYDTDLAVSLGYSSGALSIAGFYHMRDTGSSNIDGYGVGMGYDLGGGLELKTGVAASGDVLAADLGFAMTF